MADDFESQIAQALTDFGGPPELAPQLIALADSHLLRHELAKWIKFHVGEEWTAGQFNAWCWKYRRTVGALPEAIKDCPDCHEYAYIARNPPSSGTYYYYCPKHRRIED